MKTELRVLSVGQYCLVLPEAAILVRPSENARGDRPKVFGVRKTKIYLAFLLLFNNLGNSASISCKREWCNFPVKEKENQ